MQRAANLEPRQAVWQLELGNLTAAAGDLIKAKEYFVAAEALEADNPRVWESRARFSLLYHVDMRGFGLPAARRWVELEPASSQSRDVLASILFQLSDLRGAERILQQVIESDNGFSPAHLHLGQVYIELNQPDLAILQLKTASDLDGDGPDGGLARRLLERFFGVRGG